MILKSEVLSQILKSPKMTSQKTLCYGAKANIVNFKEKGKFAHPVTCLRSPNKIIILLADF